MSDLMQCPFCSQHKAALKTEADGGQSFIKKAFVECENCRARGPSFANWNNQHFMRNAEEAWNARGAD